MYNFFEKFLMDFFSAEYVSNLANILVFIIAILVSLIARFIVKVILVKIVGGISQRTKTSWDNIIFENKFFHRLSFITIPIVLNLFSNSFSDSLDFWERFIEIITFVIILLLFDSAINSIESIYRTYPISNIKPIKGILQVVKLSVMIIGGIVLIAMLIGESPIVLLGGIGAMTAVLTLVFKDAILGFVAGIQLTANDMIRIGDWIEMPKNNADGFIIDLTLTTVKVQNFDKTIVTIPAYALVSESFINWRGMQSSGGRRIKRSIFLDASDVKICDEDMIRKLKKVVLLEDYLERKTKEINEYNKTYGGDPKIPVNGRRLTNIGTYRAYVNAYLRSHPGIHQDMILMVRQLSPTSTGIPIEIYAFTNTVNWVEYEGIQSDIFDHLYSTASFFGLTVFQQPSGKDLRNLVSGNNTNSAD